MYCLGWSPKSAFLLKLARRRRGIERGGRTDDSEYHHVLGIELVNLLHGRCPFGRAMRSHGLRTLPSSSFAAVH